MKILLLIISPLTLDGENRRQKGLLGYPSSKYFFLIGLGEIN